MSDNAQLAKTGTAAGAIVIGGAVAGVTGITIAAWHGWKARRR